MFTRFFSKISLSPAKPIKIPHLTFENPTAFFSNGNIAQLEDSLMEISVFNAKGQYLYNIQVGQFINTIAILPNSNIVVASRKKIIILSSDGKQLKQIEENIWDVLSINVLANGNIAVHDRYYGRGVCIINPCTGELVKSIPIDNIGTTAHSVTSLPNNSIVIAEQGLYRESNSKQNTYAQVRFFDSHFKLLKTIPLRNGLSLHPITALSNEKIIIAGEYRNIAEMNNTAIFIVDLKRGQVLKVFNLHMRVKAIAVLSEEKAAICSLEHNSIYTMDIKHGCKLKKRISNGYELKGPLSHKEYFLKLIEPESQPSEVITSFNMMF